MLTAGAAAPAARPDEAAKVSAGRRAVIAQAAAPPILPGLGYACLAAAALYDDGDREAAATVKASADRLLGMAGRDRRGLRGWRYQGSGQCAGPGTFDAFGDKTCNPPETAYSFQTGVATACLARASLVTHDPSYARAARQVLLRWSSLAAHPCAGCVNFPYSDSPNDRGRSVRNTNVFMGMGAAWTYAALGGADIRALAVGVAATEARESARGNHGYLGVDDPSYRKNPAHESRRMENHYVAVAKGLLDIGVVAHDPRARALARAAARDWFECRGGDCGKLACASWSGGEERCDQAVQAMTPCFFRADPRFAAACARAIARAHRFSAFHVWAVADGRSPRFAVSGR
jgi:hypothetical protein